MSTKMSFLTIALIATIAVAALSSVIAVAPALAASPINRGHNTGEATSGCAQTAAGPGTAASCAPGNPFPL